MFVPVGELNLKEPDWLAKVPDNVGGGRRVGHGAADGAQLTVATVEGADNFQGMSIQKSPGYDNPKVSGGCQSKSFRGMSIQKFLGMSIQKFSGDVNPKDSGGCQSKSFPEMSIPKCLGDVNPKFFRDVIQKVQGDVNP